MYLMLTSQIVTIGSTPTALPPVALEGRKYVTIQNLGGVFVYLGNSLVTADTTNSGGFQLLPKATWSEPYSDTVNIYGVIATGSSQVYVEQGK